MADLTTIVACALRGCWWWPWLEPLRLLLAVGKPRGFLCVQLLWGKNSVAPDGVVSVQPATVTLERGWPALLERQHDLRLGVKLGRLTLGVQQHLPAGFVGWLSSAE